VVRLLPDAAAARGPRGRREPCLVGAHVSDDVRGADRVRARVFAVALNLESHRIYKQKHDGQASKGKGEGAWTEAKLEYHGKRFAELSPWTPFSISAVSHRQ